MSAAASPYVAAEPVPIELPRRVRFGYRPELDGLRAIAIVAVMLFHAPQVHLPGGFVGVDLFFVLSGFLITSLILDEDANTGKVALGAFYMRRALRLLPAVLLLLGALTAGAFIAGSRFRTSPGDILRAAGFTLVYVANWVLVKGTMAWPQSLNHLWSLAVEEQFYLVWPLVLVGCLRSRVPRRAITVGLGLAFVAIGLWRGWLWLHDAGYARVYFATDTRSDGLLLGCMLGTLGLTQGRTSARWVTTMAAVGVLGLVAALCFMDNYGAATYYGALSGVAISAALIIAALVQGRVPGLTSLLSRAAPAWIGRLSYGLYLWHNVVFFAFEHVRHPFARFDLAWEFIATGTCAVGSYYVVERPFLRLKHRFERRGPVAVVA